MPNKAATLSQFKNKALYFYTAESPFVTKDIGILETKFSVNSFCFRTGNKKRIPLVLINQFFFLIRHTLRAELVVCQFAGLHSVLPVVFSILFFRKSIIVAGGTDCVSFPSINYGNFSNKRNRFFTSFSFENCSLILPVHQTLVNYKYTYQKSDYPQQGILYFIPSLKTKIVVIHNGYDGNYWKKGDVVKEPLSFLTVMAYVNSKFTLNLKGIDLYIKLAKQFPEAKFSILGGKGLPIYDLPKNVELLSNIWGDQLIDLFAAKQFYVQLSLSEGFPNALSESMLCECVPIVSNVGGMPDIVRDTGFILEEKDESKLFQLVKNALENQDLLELGQKARERILINYGFEKRKIEFLDEVEKLLK